jgi:hypothetical protein
MGDVNVRVCLHSSTIRPDRNEHDVDGLEILKNAGGRYTIGESAAGGEYPFAPTMTAGIVSQFAINRTPMSPSISAITAFDLPTLFIQYRTSRSLEVT